MRPATKWIAKDDAAAFRSFCEDNGHETRDHTNPFLDGFQIRHQGHWMGVVWSKPWKRYMADRRLGLLVQSFAAHKHQEQGESNGNQY